MAPAVWVPFDNSCLPEVLAFLEKWEYRNVNASRYIVAPSRLPFGIRITGELHLCLREGKITGLLVPGPRGLCLPLFAAAGGETQDESEENPAASLYGRLPCSTGDFRTLMGMKDAVLALESHIGPRILESVDYHLMVYRNELPAYGLPTGDAALLPEEETLPPDFRIRIAGPGDTEVLYPVQEAYELEEVVLDPARFHPSLCYQNLKKQLKEETVLMVLHRGVPVAKAGTNSLGLNYAQMGGVFTVPEYRSRGIGRILISALIREMASRGKRFCLFVKKDNVPALRVYRRTGFRTEGDFRITYLGR